MSSKDNRGFTLIEMVAVIVIIAILASVSYPRVTGASQFSAKGYTDVIAASLRQARAVALATRCDVRFTVNGAGYQALQRGASGGHCAAVGAFTTPVLSGVPPQGVNLVGAHQVVFSGVDGSIGGGITMDLGYQSLSVDASGIVL